MKRRKRKGRAESTNFVKGFASRGGSEHSLPLGAGTPSFFLRPCRGGEIVVGDPVVITTG